MEDFADGWLSQLEMEDSDLINQCRIPTHEMFDFQNLTPDENQLSQKASAETAVDDEVIVDAFWTLNPVINKPGGNEGACACPPLSPSGQPGQVWAALNQEIPATPDMGNDEYTNLFNTSPNRSCSNVLNDDTEVIESKSLTRPPLQAKNHIIAERKRRERLNEKLIALAAVIPGLKKMDKASIIGDATRYIKHLTERVKHLERDQTRTKRDKPTVANTKQTCQCSSDETLSSGNNSSDETNLDRSDKPFPEVNMRVSDKNILLKIHCKKQEGVLERILNVLGNFSINVVSNINLPFGDAAFDITVIGKMIDEECSSKAENPLRCLRSAILKLL